MYGVKNGRRAIIFYASNLRIFELFPEETQQKMALWIMEFGFTEKMTDCPDDMILVLKPILMGIQTQLNRFKNIEMLNRMSFIIQKECVTVTDERDLKIIENAQAMIRRGIITCKKRDVDPSEVRQLLFGILSNDLMRRQVRVTEEFLNKLLAKEEQPKLLRDMKTQEQKMREREEFIKRLGPRAR